MLITGGHLYAASPARVGRVTQDQRPTRAGPAEAWPDTGGGEGQDRNGLFPPAAAVTRTSMSVRTAAGTGPGLLTLACSWESP